MPRSTTTTDEYDVITHEDTFLDEKEVAKIRAWLQPTDYLAESSEYRRHLLSRAPDTGLWITQTKEYQQWHDSPDTGSLWIKGIPGSGKSVVAASIIQRLKTTEDVPVLFFFFRNIVAANFEPRSLMKDWLAQLLPHSPELQFALKPRLDTKLEDVSEAELVDTFLEGLSGISRIYCVADALDEMISEHRSFLDRLNSLATYRPRSVKLLMTSRPKQYLQSALRDSSIVQISLEQQLVGPEIAAYLDHRFENNLKTRGVPKNELITMIAKRSQGLFLYAKLTMDQVEEYVNSAESVDVARLAASLPSGLEQTYNSMLAVQRRTYDVTIELQLLVLEAVTHACRPLRLNELASLVQFVQPTAAASGQFKRLVAASCGPLIDILEDETLQVLHHSFTEFLRGDTRSNPAGDASSDFPLIDTFQAHKHIAVHCLRYLQSGTLLLDDETSRSQEYFSSVYKRPAHLVDLDEQRENPRKSDRFDYQQAKLKHAFLSYAVDNVSYHASNYDLPDETFHHEAESFVNPRRLDYHRWLARAWGSTSAKESSLEGVPGMLHFASFCGLSNIASKVLQQNTAVDVQDSQQRTSLHWASQNGHAAVAELLLQHGANQNAEDGQGLQPIHLAARQNRASVVALLLQAGAEPTAVKTKENHSGRLLGGETITRGECPIFYVSKGGHLEATEAIIPFCTGDVLEQLLCESCRFNRTDAVLSILQKTDVSGNAMYRGATALYHACAVANSKCVEALVRRGADANKSSFYEPRRTRNGGAWPKGPEMTPLHRLLQTWSEENDSQCTAILRLLLGAGAQIEQLDGRGDTALLIAAGDEGYHKRVCISAMRALLAAGADPQQRDRKGDTALLRTFRTCRKLDALRLLVQWESNPNDTDSQGCTALHKALQKPGGMTGTDNTEEIVSYLVEHGADPTIADKRGRTPIEAAVSVDFEVFKSLLPYCKDESIRRRCWFGLDAYMKRESLEPFIDLLLSEGVDVESRRQDGRTLLLSHPTRTELVGMLRKRGAEVDAVDDSGKNILHLLESRQHMEKYIAEGIDPLSTTNNGDTLLHHVAYGYHGKLEERDFVHWLIKLGISVNAANGKGLTPLHAYIDSNYPVSMKRSSGPVHFIDALSGHGEQLELNARDCYGLTPLHLAVTRSHRETLQLMMAGSDVEALDSSKHNVLHLASRARQSSIVGHLVQKTEHCLVDAQDSDGLTPLHYACASGRVETVAYLLRGGADANAKTPAGRTALHFCADYPLEQRHWSVKGKEEVLFPGRLKSAGTRKSSHKPWYKQEYGVDTSSTCEDFMSTSAIASLLLGSGVAAAAVDTNEYSALDVALENQCSELIELFASDQNLLEKLLKPAKSNRIDPVPRVQAQLALMRPVPYMSRVAEGNEVYSEVSNAPRTYLKWLSAQDLDLLIANRGKDALDATWLHELGAECIDFRCINFFRHTTALKCWVQETCNEGYLQRLMQSEREKNGYYARTPAYSALHLACRQEKSNMELLRTLVETCNANVNARCMTCPQYERRQTPKPGGTALHMLAIASSWWQLGAMRYLASQGANVNATDEHGRTPLHIAARGKPLGRGMMSVGTENHGSWCSEAVRVLLDLGADPNVLDCSGLSALHQASNSPDIMRELLQRGANPDAGEVSPIFQVIRDQNLEALEIMLDKGASVDSFDSRSDCLDDDITEPVKKYALLCATLGIMNAGAKDSAPLVRTLVEKGANLYLPVNDNETLIHWIFERSKYEIVDTLMKQPCVSRIDFNEKDQRGRTVLMAAANWTECLPGYRHRHWDGKVPGLPIRMLDTGRSDATITDEQGKTALHHLLDNPDMEDEVVMQLVDRPEVQPTVFTRDGHG
ncbi:hypothetical protein FOQG_06417 [Lecanosticta acicola]|uniref:NACHT domain-containing protein n=1 Tax=Lecanosticta acicola TaxID=111012 RepID=A0AAI8Z260_9PEZI|nr:hypothetical protein FOQG_06417 [Lecanosticta acicola]